jgi:hypothetical protein
MTDQTVMLRRLGDALEECARADLAAGRGSKRTSKRLVAALATLAVVLPGAALGVGRLLDPDDVARSLPAGTLSLAGTEPRCTVVRQDVEYRCVLTRAPAPEVSDWKGTVEPTVDATKHVNGGCRSLDSAGLHWACYLGQKAVDEEIIGPDFLGEYAPAPGHG